MLGFFPARLAMQPHGLIQMLITNRTANQAICILLECQLYFVIWFQ